MSQVKIELGQLSIPTGRFKKAIKLSIDNGRASMLGLDNLVYCVLFSEEPLSEHRESSLFPTLVHTLPNKMIDLADTRKINQLWLSYDDDIPTHVLETLEAVSIRWVEPIFSRNAYYLLWNLLGYVHRWEAPDKGIGIVSYSETGITTQYIKHSTSEVPISLGGTKLCISGNGKVRIASKNQIQIGMMEEVITLDDGYQLSYPSRLFLRNPESKSGLFITPTKKLQTNKSNSTQ